MNAQKANNTNNKVRQLQRKLYLSAKLNGKRRYHALYDKIHRMDILSESWKRVRANKGSGGVDGMTLAEVESYGADKLLKELSESLREGTYRPMPVKRVDIPKGNGKMRPLGLPTVKDKIVQMAAKIVIEPVFEADFKDCSYGFRPKKNQHMALDAVRKALGNKGYWAVDVDIKGYFDNINHEKLMILVESRISDRRVLKLIRQWLSAGVMIGGKLEETELGSPQGGVISPLLSNIYLNYLDKLWERHGSHLGKLVRYADDLVVICKTKKDANHAMGLIRHITGRLELELNNEKTKLVSMWEGKEGFDFLGMHHRSMKQEHPSGRWYFRVMQFPSKKAMKRMRSMVKEVMGRRGALIMDLEDMIKLMNPKIRGWRNYYGLSTAEKWLRKLDWHILQWFTRWWNKKRQKRLHLSQTSIVRQLVYRLGLQKLVHSAC